MRDKGFTLAELLVTISIVVILILFVSRLFLTATTVTTLGQKRMDADAQARQVFERLAGDFAAMVIRPDIDSYVKGIDPENGNDTIAFFSAVPGYYPSSSSQSSVSLVSYRIYSPSSPPSSCPDCNKMQRMAKGLLWNGASATNPLIFGGTPTLQANWPTAWNGTADPDYEVIGPQIFRFEYFYLLKDGTVAIAPTASGMSGVAAISICIAVVDPKSKVLLNNSQLSTLAGRLSDCSATMKRGELLSSWQTTLNGITDMPRGTISAVRLYERDFYLQ